MLNVPPKISPIIFFVLRFVEGYLNMIPDPTLRLIIDTVCKLGEAVTIYLIAKGVILAIGRTGK